MKTFYTLTVGEAEYRLRLTATAIKSIEKKLGQPLFTAVENMQDDFIDTVATIFWGAMQPMNANFPFEKAYDLIDQYIDEGNSVEDLMMEIKGLFEASGFFSKGQDE